MGNEIIFVIFVSLVYFINIESIISLNTPKMSMYTLCLARYGGSSYILFFFIDTSFQVIYFLIN